MWRTALLAGLVLGFGLASANVFSEGGGRIAVSSVQNSESQYPEANGDVERFDREAAALQRMLQEQQQLENAAAEEEEARQAEEREMSNRLSRQEELAKLLDQLQLNNEIFKEDGEDRNKQPQAPLPDTLLPAKAAAPAPSKIDTEMVGVAPAHEEAPPPQLHKKGESEFVSFVDPALTKSIPNLEKRKMQQVRVERIRNDGNLLFLAVGTVMVVGLVGGATGGFLYWRRRQEEPDDQEYAPYAGTGPRKLKGNSEKGDETLAYKAQLHHYQNAKQKIICGEANAGMAGETDEEGEDVDDENNFSVYECPGLAPTGDLEVHNPNFAAAANQQP